MCAKYQFSGRYFKPGLSWLRVRSSSVAGLHLIVGTCDEKRTIMRSGIKVQEKGRGSTKRRWVHSVKADVREKGLSGVGNV